MKIALKCEQREKDNLETRRTEWASTELFIKRTVSSQTRGISGDAFRKRLQSTSVADTIGFWGAFVGRKQLEN